MFENFFDDYDEFAGQVTNASYRLIANALQRWLGLLDENPLAAKQLEPLENSMDFDKWYADCEATQGGMIGSAKLTFPLEKDKRLGAQLFLMRKAAADEDGAVDIGHTFLSTDSNFEANVREFQAQIFEPLRQELRTYLQRHMQDKAQPEQPSTMAPASDRVVPLDHNSNAYKDAIASLNAVRDSVAASNEYDDEADKGQRLAELDAAKTLLSAPRVRASAMRAVAVPCLKYLGEKFVEGVIAVAVTTAIVALAALFGYHLLM